PPNEDCDPPGSFVLTQNNDPDTIDPLDGSIACRVEDDFTFENAYARSYDLSDPIYGLQNEFVEVVCVRIASQSNDGFAYPVTVNVYEDTDGGEPTSPGTDLNLLGSKVVWIPVGARGFLEAQFDEPVRVVANRMLVVELEAPNRDPRRTAIPWTFRPAWRTPAASSPAPTPAPSPTASSDPGRASPPITSRFRPSVPRATCPSSCRRSTWK
ncbi:MAG: hypothetical protein ACYTAQ_00345, partial [Planctomycetota bacterium]